MNDANIANDEDQEFFSADSTFYQKTSSGSDSGEYMRLSDSVFINTGDVNTTEERKTKRKKTRRNTICVDSCAPDCTQKSEHGDRRIRSLFSQIKSAPTSPRGSCHRHVTKEEESGKRAWYYIHFINRIMNKDFEPALRDFLKCVIFFIEQYELYGISNDKLSKLSDILYDETSSIKTIRESASRYFVVLCDNRKFAHWYHGYCLAENKGF